MLFNLQNEESFQEPKVNRFLITIKIVEVIIVLISHIPAYPNPPINGNPELAFTTDALCQGNYPILPNTDGCPLGTPCGNG